MCKSPLVVVARRKSPFHCIRARLTWSLPSCWLGVGACSSSRAWARTNRVVTGASGHSATRCCGAWRANRAHAVGKRHGQDSLPGPAFVNPRLLTPHPPADWPARCFVMFAEQSHPDKLRRRLIQHHNNAVSRLVYSVLSTVRVQALPTCSRLASPGDPMRAQVRVKRSFQPLNKWCLPCVDHAAAALGTQSLGSQVQATISV